MQSFLTKQSKYFFTILFLSLLPSISFAQFLTAENNVIESNRSANEGTYSYSATVKVRANNPSKNDVRLQFSIISYQIDRFEFNGEHYEDLYPEIFPIKISNIRSDLEAIVTFGSRNNNFYEVEKTIRGVSSGAFDITHLTNTEVQELADRLSIKNSTEFYLLPFSFRNLLLTNSYFEELDKLKTRRKNDLLKEKKEEQIKKVEEKEKQTQKKIVEHNEYMAKQERKANEKLKELEIAAERDRKNQELADLNAKVASGHRATNAGYEQTGTQKAQQYIDQMNAEYDVLQKSLNTSISKFFKENVKQENNALEKYAKAEAGYEKVNLERKRRNRQVEPIRSLLSILYEGEINYELMKQLDSGNVFIQLIQLSTKSGSTVYDYTNAAQKSYVPSVDDFITDVLPAYYVYSSDVITIPIKEINSHQYLFNNYIYDIKDKSRYSKNGYGVFAKVFFKQEHLNNYMNALNKNYDPTSVLDFRIDNSKFYFESFESFVSKNLEKERQYNLRIAQQKLYENGTTTKTYDNGDFYEGDFLNRKRHGQGKMVYNSGGIYEGKWVKDDRNGLGKMTYPDGDVYEGEWKDGYRDGQGIHKFSYGHVYNGLWVKDERNGQGKMTYRDGRVYEGGWKDNKENGLGTLRSQNGDIIFQGEYQNGQKISGTRSGYFGVYEGEMDNGFKNGKGTMKYSNGDIYQGEWENGRRNGKGIMKYSNGDVYEGEWSDEGKWSEGYRHSTGTMTYSNGDIYQGEWEMNQKHGKGTMEYSNGNVYQGKWVNDKKGGKGTMTYANGSIFEGLWRAGKRSGIGTMRNSNGDLFIGEWIKDKRNYWGYKLLSDGNIYESFWENGVALEENLIFTGARLLDSLNFESWLLKNLAHITYRPKAGVIDINLWVTIDKQGELKIKKHSIDYSYEALVGETNSIDVEDNLTKKILETVKSSPLWTPGTYKGKATSDYQYIKISCSNYGLDINHKKNITGGLIRVSNSSALNSSIYVGEFHKGLHNGNGRLLRYSGFERSMYDGEFKNDYKAGKGTMSYPNGNIYTGEWKKHQMHGKGTMEYSNGNVYEGEWKDGKRNGFGTMTYANGEVYKGEWKNGKKQG